MTPRVWCVLLKELFGASQKLSCKLWKASPVTPTLLWQLSLCDGHEANHMVLVGHLQRLAHLLPPHALLAASVKVAPETGKVRLRAAVDFEEAVLRLTTHRGNWKW